MCCEPGHSETIEVCSRQNRMRGAESSRPPPASRKTGPLLHQPLGDSARAKSTTRGPATFPLFELQCSQTAVYPPVERGKYPRRIR